MLKPRSYVSGGFAMNGQMAIQFPKHEGIKCYAVVSGQCWLVVESIPEPILLTAGDCFLLPRGLPFCLATDLTAPRTDFRIMLAARRVGQPIFYDNSGENYSVGGHFLLSGPHAETLLSSLPPVVHIQKEADKAAMRWALDRMREELQHAQPGSSLIAQQLAYTMLVQALRLHLTEEAATATGWLAALADRQMRAAIACMHDNPGHAWTLQELAERVGMSRSIFAQRFKQRSGVSAIDYLTRWRMLLAAERLESSGDSIATIAAGLGYDSESAFGKAFKRVMACSPRQYTRRAGREHLAKQAKFG